MGFEAFGEGVTGVVSRPLVSKQMIANRDITVISRHNPLTHKNRLALRNNKTFKFSGHQGGKLEWKVSA